MNSCKFEIVRHEAKLREIVSTLENLRISFSRNKFDISDWKSFGSIRVESSPCNITYTAIKMNQAQVLPTVPNQTPTAIVLPMKFTLQRKFDVKSSASVQITGIVVTDDNRLILCNTNKTELLVYSDCGDYLQDCTLEGKPWDIAIIPGEDKTVVALTRSSKIQFIDTKSMKSGSSHHVPGVCHGITLVDDKICVAGFKVMYILSKQGKHGTTITIPNTATIFYLHPESRDSVLYTSVLQHTSGCVKLSGEIIFTYTNARFYGPEAIITDNRGNIYIACKSSNNIHRLTSEGECTDIVLTENNRINKPYGLACNKDYTKSFVSADMGKRILVFICS